MDAALVDLPLAIVHHGLAFLLVALLAVEMALVRPGLKAESLPLLARIDAAYGGAAGLLIAIGICRVLLGLKGWEYYVYYPVFWLKMACFAAVGLLTVQPTRRILRWRRESLSVVPEDEIRALRKWLNAQAVGLALVVVFAAAMARGIGY